MKVTFDSSTDALREGVCVGFVVKDGKLPPMLAELDERTSGQLSRACEAVEFKGGEGQSVDIPAPAGLADVSRVLIIGAGKAEDLDEYAAERLGGRMAAALRAGKVKRAAVAAGLPEDAPLDAGSFAARVASGARLRNYSFDAYKTKKNGDGERENDKKPLVEELTMVTPAAKEALEAFAPLALLADAVHMARDLVNEPGNVLNPKTFAARVEELGELGLEVEVLGPRQLKADNFNALLAVGQGSRNKPRVVVMRHDGGKKGDKPLAFIGKGVTFDSGGISIKPSASMDEMKGDMGGAAAVVGVMRALAARKAKVNAVGVIGLVENMPDGKAQRPGDIVISRSGQSIAVLNTDAEGRLVLADCLDYAKEKFDPALMINLATLTGAIIVSLGKEHAGLFSNDDELAGKITEAGKATGERVWRLPLDEAYDKMIDHDMADMKNLGSGRGEAGSIVAAQFLQRFVGDVPWAHLDIAGTAMAAPKSDINDSWGSGWGVRLLNRLVEEREE